MKPKETLEDFIKEELEDIFFTNIAERSKAENLIRLGAEWQDEELYSEEEVKHIVSEALQSALVKFDLEQWFKQFKNK